MGLAVTKQESFWEACGFGRVHEVREFLKDKNIKVNWKSYTHESCPIHVASQGKAEIVQMLIEAGCDVNARDDRDNLAIHHAAMKGHADIIRMLIDAGSQIDAQDKNGWTPLLNAAYWCQPDAVQTLIEFKCDVHLKNKDSRSALHEACRSASKDEEALARIVEMLVDCESDLNSKGSDVGGADFTPLMFCGYHGHAKVAKILIDSDCDINAQGSNGWSALHWAADRNHLETVQVLLNGGINPMLKANRDELAVERASDEHIRDAILDAMHMTASEYRSMVEERDFNRNKIDVMTSSLAAPEQDASTVLSSSPVGGANYIESSVVFRALQQQMSDAATLSRKKKSKKLEKRISQRIFEPPQPPTSPEEEKAKLFFSRKLAKCPAQ